MDPSSRRDFMKTVVCAGVAVACGGCGGRSAATLPTGDVTAGKVADTAVGMLRAVVGSPIFVGRDSAGLYAMTAICNHADCDMTIDGTITAQGATCTCHGSRFDNNGNVLQGPARSPLTHLALSVDASGLITVHPTQTVPAPTRTVV
jgi:cytochrome b6-f complex iron-sulfur subunit